MSKDVGWNTKEVHLKDDDLSQLPDGPTCPSLVKLSLKLPSLTTIPPTFFQCMPQLLVLDISNTNILSLPPSISSLRLLQEFFLRDCSALIELPPEIGMLTKLRLFYIIGTEIMYIPKEIGNLEDLEHLRVSLSQYADYYIKTKGVNVIPRKMISKLKKLKELCISVSPEAKWWENEVEAIQHELCHLVDLQTLQWYMPTNRVFLQFLQVKRNHLPMYSSLLNFTLTIGQHAQLTSCLPCNLEKKFEEFKKCLKWINDEGDTDDISMIMENVEALFLSRHWTLQKLSTFNITKLKYCLLVECNKMRTLVEVDELSSGLETCGLESLQYLSIYYMKELQSIWKGPIGRYSLSKLRILALHTCPSLTTIFTASTAQNLSCLVELIVEDCPKVKNLITYDSPGFKSGILFPSLEKIFLLDLPELVNIYDGLTLGILWKVHNLLIHNCLKLTRLSITELPHIKEIKGDTGWWNEVNCDKSKWNSIFVPLKEQRALVEELVEATSSLQHFNDSVFLGNDEKESDSTNVGQVIQHDTTREKEKGMLPEDKVPSTSMASSSMPSSPVPASSSRVWEYDVFLSFRGEDTRETFVDHLYSELKERLIHTYKDGETLPRGDSIGSSLLRAIEESRIAIIIFSKNYANSSWCLDELTHIMKCRDERGQVVIPIFYDVDPSDVRHQKGKFAFDEQKEKNMTKAESWRKALADAGAIAGWEPKKIANGLESEGIKLIVNTILDKLLCINSGVDKDLVGMGTRIHLLKSQLKLESSGVRMLGIWGVGGVGKTTLASCAYGEINHHFLAHCFIENIREESTKHGLKKLQEKLLKSCLKTKVKVECVEDGKRKIQERLCHSKVLIVLDDVDHIDQLKALSGSHDWFGDGSRVIITTRNEQLLRTHRVDGVSTVSLLSRDEAIELFCRHAYRQNEPVKDYEELSLDVVSYAGGLPLVLKVLGCSLYDKDNNVWLSTLARLKDNPNMEIMQKLKISYDGLEPLEKELFLDIACFFRGAPVDKTMEILEACEFYPHIGINVLIQKALIYVSKDDDDEFFDMHDRIQEMGQHIVQGEYRGSPEEHSRLWQTELIDDLCSRDVIEPNNKIKAISYDGYSSRFPELISNMKKLRLLQVGSYNHFLEGPNFLSNELRYLKCEDYRMFVSTKFSPNKVSWTRIDK